MPVCVGWTLQQPSAAGSQYAVAMTEPTDAHTETLMIWTADQNKILGLGMISVIWLAFGVGTVIQAGSGGLLWAVVFLIGGGTFLWLTVTPDRFSVTADILTVQRRGRRQRFALGAVSVDAEHPRRQSSAEFPVLVIDGGVRFGIPKLTVPTDIRDPRSATGKIVLALEARIASARRAQTELPPPAGEDAADLSCEAAAKP